MLHEDDLGAVGAQDVACVDQGPRQGCTANHEHDKANVRAVVDGTGRVVDVLAEGNLLRGQKESCSLQGAKPEAGQRSWAYQRAENASHVENHPEPGNVLALVLLARIAHHDCALRRPQAARAGAEKSTGEDDESLVLGVVVAQEAGNIDTVAHPTKRQRKFDSDQVNRGAGEESDDGEGRVEGDVGIVGGRPIQLARGTDTVNGVEHAGAEEAHAGDEDDLRGRRCVPRAEGPEFPPLVHPRRPDH